VVNVKQIPIKLFDVADLDVAPVGIMGADASSQVVFRGAGVSS